MKNLNIINKNILISNSEKIKVTIIDSGFKKIPEYAFINGINEKENHFHGNRIVSIFSAPDKTYPIKDISLQLICYNEAEQYDGLIKALEKINHADILSISLLWNEDRKDIKKMIFEKADKIICPYPKDESENIYPAVYNNVITCSNTENNDADYCICPNPLWRGNSYAVPAVARIMAYDNDIVPANPANGIKAEELFHIDKNKEEQTPKPYFIKCPHCKRVLRKNGIIPYKEYPELCPYCGISIKL